MPKKYARKNQRKMVSRRRKFARKRAKKYVLPQGLTSSRFVQKHRYVDRISLDPGVATSAYHTFKATGMYDPDYTGTGHQPLLFDTMTNLYNHFTVIGSIIKCTFASGTEILNAGVSIVGIELNGGTTPSVATDFITSLEQKRDTSAVLGGGASGKAVIVLRKGFSAKRFFSQNVLNEDDNAGTASSDPTENAYFHVHASGINATVNPTSLSVLVEIEYTAVWHEPKLIAGS